MTTKVKNSLLIFVISPPGKQTNLKTTAKNVEKSTHKHTPKHNSWKDIISKRKKNNKNNTFIK